jgi:hypothetical protein
MENQFYYQLYNIPSDLELHQKIATGNWQQLLLFYNSEHNQFEIEAGRKENSVQLEIKYNK